MAFRVSFVFFLFLSFALLSTTGCNSRRGGSRPRDSGPAMTVDSGRTEGDSSIVLMDSGTPPDSSTTTPECDATRPCPTGLVCVDNVCMARPPECDATRPCPPGQRCSAGMCVPDDVRVCAGSDVTYARESICSSTTAACIDACTDSTCLGGCLDRDPDPNCGACVSNNVVACLNMDGCQPAWDTYVCCLEDECGVTPPTGCVAAARDGACSSQNAAYDRCGDGVELSTVCPTLLADCF